MASYVENFLQYCFISRNIADVGAANLGNLGYVSIDYEIDFYQPKTSIYTSMSQVALPTVAPPSLDIQEKRSIPLRAKGSQDDLRRNKQLELQSSVVRSYRDVLREEAKKKDSSKEESSDHVSPMKVIGRPPKTPPGEDDDYVTTPMGDLSLLPSK